MKHIKKIFAVVLAVVMLLSIAPMSAFAQNGPMLTPENYGYGDVYLSWIKAYEPDAQGRYYNEYLELAGPQYHIFQDLVVNNQAYPGITYDLEHNTLTLTNVVAPTLVLTTNVMGDDFNICLVGTNALAHIEIWGDGYGGSLSFSGSGTLRVNQNTFFDYAINMNAEGTAGQVSFGKDVNVHLYGIYGAIFTAASTAASGKQAYLCANGQVLEEVEESPVHYTKSEEINGIYLYDAEANNSGGWLATSKSDPTGIYGVTYGYKTDPSEEWYWVSKYVYMEKYDSYVCDFNYFQDEENFAYGQLEFTRQQWEAQDEFTLKTVLTEQPDQIRFRKEADKDDEGNWMWYENHVQSASDPTGVYAYSTGKTLEGDYYCIHRFYFDESRNMLIRDDTFTPIELRPDQLAQNGWSIVYARENINLEYTGNYTRTWGNVYKDTKGNKYIQNWGDGVYSFKEGEGVTLSDGFYYYLTKENNVAFESLEPCQSEIEVPGQKNYCLYTKDFLYGADSGEAHIHQYRKQVIAPTATTLGYTQYVCACGEVKRDAKGNVIISDITAPTGKQKIRCAARTANAEKIQWNQVKTATGYQVQISTKDGKKWDTYYNLKAGVTSCTFKKLAAGNAYKFRVRFYIKGADGKNHYSPWSATLTSPTLPAGTTLTKLTGGSKSFTAQWKKQAKATGYQVQYSTKSDFSGAKTLTVKNVKTLKLVIKKLKAGTKYYVRIRTYKTMSGANYFSAWSAVKTVKTKGAAASSASTSRTVYITRTGKRYHYDSKCGNGTYIKSTLKEALSKGLTPCQKCVHS